MSFTAEDLQTMWENGTGMVDSGVISRVVHQAASQARQLATLRAMRGEIERLDVCDCFPGSSCESCLLLRRLLDALGTEVVK